MQQRVFQPIGVAAALTVNLQRLRREYGFPSFPSLPMRPVRCLSFLFSPPSLPLRKGNVEKAGFFLLSTFRNPLDQTTDDPLPLLHLGDTATPSPSFFFFFFPLQDTTTGLLPICLEQKRHAPKARTLFSILPTVESSSRRSSGRTSPPPPPLRKSPSSLKEECLSLGGWVPSALC